MRIELSPISQAKLDDILEQLYTMYDLEDLSSEELIDALLDIGVDLVMAEECTISLAKDRLVTLCASKITSRG